MPFFVNTSAYTIDDVYIGGEDSRNRDVIGRLSQFDALGANVVVEGTVIMVGIHTNFADAIGTYGSATYSGDGVGVGDCGNRFIFYRRACSSLGAILW